VFLFFSSRRRHTRSKRDWSSDVCSSDLKRKAEAAAKGAGAPPPVVQFDLADFTPALRNDTKLVGKTATVFREVLGADTVLERQRSEERRVGKEGRAGWGGVG